MRASRRHDRDSAVANDWQGSIASVEWPSIPGTSLAASLPMPRRFALALVTLAAATSSAGADPGPPVAVGLDYTVGHGGRVEALDLGWRLEAGLFVRAGRWHATVSVPVHPTIASANPERDTGALTGVGLGTRLAYRLPVGGLGVFSFGAGITRRWMHGGGTVVRTCRQTGACVAGFYPEEPAYHAWAPQLRIGIGPEKRLPSMILGASAELIVEAIGLHDVPPDGIRGIAVSGAVTFTIGGGPRRRSPASAAGR